VARRAKALLRRGIKFILREDYCAVGRDSSSSMFARSVQSDEIALIAPSARPSANRTHCCASFPPFLRSGWTLVRVCPQGEIVGIDQSCPMRPSLSRRRLGRANLCTDELAGMEARLLPDARASLNYDAFTGRLAPRTSAPRPRIGR
jgi:hypothetical protein